MLEMLKKENRRRKSRRDDVWMTRVVASKGLLVGSFVLLAICFGGQQGVAADGNIGKNLVDVFIGTLSLFVLVGHELIFGEVFVFLLF